MDEQERPAQIVRERAPHGEAAKVHERVTGAAATPAPIAPEEETAYESASELAKALHIKKKGKFTAAYEHPWAVRMAHWLNAISLFVLAGSGLRIFRAFPSFGPKIPQKDFLHVPTQLTLGGWLAGALQWHFTFMWIFVGTGVFYLLYEFISGHYKTALFMPRDIKGVWPMVRHYFLFGPQPPLTEQYNPLQKLAYTSAVAFGVLATLTGIVLYKPAQFSEIAWIFGGYHMARVWHFVALCGFLAFIPGHLLMVALHGWNNFYSMLGGWKRNPEYWE
jgi:Ni/Fe-hydrogenase b-type cytochrome subunit